MSLFAFVLFAFFACSEKEEFSSSSGEVTDTSSESASEALSEPPEADVYASLPEYRGEHSLDLPETESACESFTVVIDAGHGQRDPGNMALDVKESDINLALALRLGSILKEMGYHVLLTREDDRAMLGDNPNYDTDKEAEARRLWAVGEGADLYISIHCNAADEAARGTRMFYNARPVAKFEGAALAICYKEALNREFSSEIAAGEAVEVKTKYVNGMQEDIYIVLQDLHMPALLIEIGFMTNGDDLNLLLNDDYLWEYAHALALGTDEARGTVLDTNDE